MIKNYYVITCIFPTETHISYYFKAHIFKYYVEKYTHNKVYVPTLVKSFGTKY